MRVWELHFYWISIISGTQPDAHNLLLNINTLFISLCQNYLHHIQKQEINFSNRKAGLLNRCFNFKFDEKHWRTTRSETVSTIRYKESYSEVSIFLVKQRRVFIKVNLHKLLAEHFVPHYWLWKYRFSTIKVFCCQLSKTVKCMVKSMFSDYIHVKNGWRNVFSVWARGKCYSDSSLESKI